MKEHLTLVADPLQSANRALKGAVEDLQRALAVPVRTVVEDDPLQALSLGEANLAIIDAIATTDRLPNDFVVPATLHRRPARDRILSLSGVLQPTWSNPFGISDGARVEVTSLRQAGPLLSHCKARITIASEYSVDPLKFVSNGEIDAIVVSGARFYRLAYDHELFSEVVLPHEVQLPAPGEQALVLVAGKNSPFLDRLTELNDPSTVRCVAAELELLRLVGTRGPGLGCLAQQTPDGDIRLAACLVGAGADLHAARVDRVASATKDPREAARLCAAALEEVEPHQSDILHP